MSDSYPEWAARHPQAAIQLQLMLGALPWPTNTENEGKSEGWSQQQARFKVGHAGAFAWRNNNGATPAKCPDCGARHVPIRYGLANDSAKLNEKLKSSDLILAVPRVITPVMVGTTIAQFGSLEMKRPGWKYTGKGQEPGQAAWLSLIESIGGYARFSTGEVDLDQLR